MAGLHSSQHLESETGPRREPPVRRFSLKRSCSNAMAAVIRTALVCAVLACAGCAVAGTPRPQFAAPATGGGGNDGGGGMGGGGGGSSGGM